jgi:hypothetical protein
MRGVETDDADADFFLRHERMIEGERQPSCDEDDPESSPVWRSHP